MTPEPRCRYCGDPVSGGDRVRVESHDSASERLGPTLYLHAACFEQLVQLADDHRAWLAQIGGYSSRGVLPRWCLEERASTESDNARAVAHEPRKRARAQRGSRDRHGTPLAVLEGLGLNSRAIGALYYVADIVTVEQLLLKTRAEVRAMRCIGPRSLEQLVAALGLMGLTLADDVLGTSRSASSSSRDAVDRFQPPDPRTVGRRTTGSVP